MGIAAMVSSYNSNSRRVKKPTYFESAEAKKLKYKSIRKKTASTAEIEQAKIKVQKQNKIENIIYGVIIIGILIITPMIF